MLQDRTLHHFNSIKVQLKPTRKKDVHITVNNFNSIKVQLKHSGGKIKNVSIHDFNSIKVQLKPLVFGYIISLFSTGFANAKLRNLIKKMSMGNYIFSCVLRQPLFLRCYNKSNS